MSYIPIGFIFYTKSDENHPYCKLEYYKNIIRKVDYEVNDNFELVNAEISISSMDSKRVIADIDTVYNSLEDFLNKSKEELITEEEWEWAKIQ